MKTPDDDSAEPSHLPTWARVALEASAKVAASPTQSVLDHKSGPAWPLLLDAAIVSSFLPGDLGYGLVKDDTLRATAESTVLEFAEQTHSPLGPRWTLAPAARAAIFENAATSGELAAASERTAGRFTDALSTALRDRLSATTPVDVGLEKLEATRVVTSWLSGVSAIPAPTSLDELDREIELRRLMSRFERMTGHVPGSGQEDRFFGRSGEIERLRAFVGVIAASTLRQRASRAMGTVSRVLHGQRPLSLWGIGGVGKTTLVAKFMLEHAKAASDRFPFAYLDFDRSTVSGRNCPRLLAEMCSQVAAQFAEISEPMTALRARVYELGQRVDRGAGSDAASLLKPYAAEFRSHIDGMLDDRETWYEHARPFLLVFDTFEIVQYSPEEVAALEEFVSGFDADRGPWSRLRLILSGRRQVELFMGDTVDELPLGPLDRDGSIDMIRALARDAGKSIAAREAVRLVDAIRKAQRTRGDVGVDPLKLRLVGDIFGLDTDNDGPSIVTRLVRDFTNPTGVAGATSRNLIDGILVRRVLGHVRDARVAALADPGLVVRQITPDVIRDVMTRGTPRPVEGRPDVGDDTSFEPWVVSQEDAKEIFDAFAREVSLVEADGPDLRHRQDIRREMVPLIRARRPKRFRMLHQFAYDFFRTRAIADAKDVRSAGEAVYHGLWLDAPLDEIDVLWPSTVQPRIDPDEYDDDSVAPIYVRAKNGDGLEPKEIKQLPTPIALAWLDARSSVFLKEYEMTKTIAAVQAVVGDNHAALAGRPETGSVVARLLYRAGQWRDAHDVVLGQLADTPPPELGKRLARPIRDSTDADAVAHLVSLVRTWATLAGKGGSGERELKDALEVCRYVVDPLVCAETLAHIQLGFCSRVSMDHPLRDSIDALLGDAVRLVPTERWRSEIRILRLAILTCDRAAASLIPVYVEGMERPSRNRAVVESLRRILGETGDAAWIELKDTFDRLTVGRPVPGTFKRLDAFWRRHSEVIRDLSHRPELAHEFLTLIVGDHYDWTAALGNALSRASESSAPMIDRLQSLVSPSRGKSVLGGVALVRSAMDAGQLLELAHIACENAPTAPSDVYPQDADELAAALLRWDGVLTAAAEERAHRLSGGPMGGPITPAPVPSAPVSA